MNIKDLIKKAFLPLMLVLLVASCQEEVSEVTDPENDQEVLVADSELGLSLNTTIDSKVYRNKVLGDARKCYRLNYPITVSANDSVVVINEKKDFKIVKKIFNESDDDVDTLDVSFPITLTNKKEDTEVVVNSQEELEELAAECVATDDDDDDDNHDDDDHDCNNHMDIFGGKDCFKVDLPVTVTANGIEVTIRKERDYKIVKKIFDESKDDVDTLEITFPITIKQRRTETVVNSQDELDAIIAECEAVDDDVDCIRFQYPVSVSIYDFDFQVIDVITIVNDEEFYDFLGTIDGAFLASLNFPITIILSDDSTVEVNNNRELFEVIRDACN